jgi:hypothetical protein
MEMARKKSATKVTTAKPAKSRGTAKVLPVQPGETPLFDGVMGMVERLSPEDKGRLSQTSLLLLACAEDDRLNMNKVAELLTKITDGKMTFQR